MIRLLPDLLAWFAREGARVWGEIDKSRAYVHTPTRPYPLGTILLLGCLVLGACRGGASPEEGQAASKASEAPAFRNIHGEADFMGDEACFACHEDLYRGYQEHGMARSYYRLTEENAVEDFSAAPLFHAQSGFSYRVFAQDGRFFQEEYRMGANSEKSHRLVREMQYVVGSGTAARTYLTENEGRLYELPLTWYTQAGRWDFSPGYAEHNTRFDRLVPDRCMACHNSFPEPVPFAEGKYGAVPQGIGCERCHGPGSLHIEERLADPEPAGTVDPTIVNPAHLSLERRLDVCQQCHLQGAVSVLREGRGPFDYRPSEPLAAHVALFAEDVPPSSDRISVISHADRMKQSACFLGTLGESGAMECTTCHNPHEGFRTKGPAYFNDTCLTCHQPAALAARFDGAAARALHTPEANCFTCHMPKVEAEDAPHASFTDHWIRVVKDAPAPPAQDAAQPVKLVPYLKADRAEGGVYEGMAYVIYGRQNGSEAALRKGAALLAEALEGEKGHGEAHFLRGFAHLQLGEVEEALPALEDAVQQDPGVPERLNALAQAYEAARRDPAKIDNLYQRALSIQPALADVRLNYGRFLEMQGRLAEALAQYERAAEEQPWLAAAHYNLGTAYLRLQRSEEAEAALRRALNLKPDYPDALGNLGLLYASRGELEKARGLFERAVEAAPGDAVALGNLGTYHLNAGNLARARDLLQRAVEADPRYVDGLANLALAHFQSDDLDSARRYARRALDLNPNHPLARQLIAAL